MLLIGTDFFCVTMSTSQPLSDDHNASKVSVSASTVRSLHGAAPTSDDLEKQSASDVIAEENKDGDDTTGPVQMSQFRRIIVFLSLALTMLLASLDLTIITTAIPKIAQEFNALSSATWIATAYMLTTTALQPLYGRLSDTFGRVPMLISSIIIFFAGSAICGWSKSMGVLIFGRAFQGIGGAGLVALVFIIISDVTTEEERPAYLGVLGAVWSLASVIGPVLGGVFSDKVTWRWAFLINLPISGVVLLIVIFLLRLPQPKGSLLEKLKKVDFLGSLVLVGAVVMIMLALTWGGKDFPWKSARVICLLVFGILLLGIFLLIEWKTNADPTVPIHLFRNRNVCLSVLGQFFMGVAMFAPMFFVPIWYTIVKNAGSITAGLHLLPYLLSLSLVSVVSGFIVTKWGRYRELVIFGTAVFVVGTGLMVLFDEKISSGKQIGFMILSGFGLGLNIQILLIVVQAAADKKDMAASTTLFLFTRVLGASIGLAILQSVLQNALLPRITDLVAQYPEYTKAFFDSVNDQAAIYHSNLPDDVRVQLVHAYVLALRKVFIATVPFAAIAFLFTLPIKHIPLRADIKPGVAE
ncbi:MFS general substrate transporter [Martensiomyces pterosporus]|nr:MFS general substrate transporter [Martensiomyces pterosporus]